MIKALIKKYSQIFPIIGWGIALLIAITLGSKLLPEKVDVALIAGLVTIFGVSANHFFQALGHRDQEKHRREFEVRRDIYLQFAEATAKNWARLGKLLRFDLDESKVRGSANDFIAAGNKVKIVGSTRTVESYETLYRAFLRFEIGIRQKRNALNVRVNEIKQLDAQFKQNQETMTQINTHLQNMKPSGMLSTWTAEDNARIASLQQQFVTLASQNTELSTKRVGLASDLVEAEKSYRNDYIRGAYQINPLVTEMMLSIRVELDVTVDEDWYRQVMGLTNDEMKQTFERVIEEIPNPHAPKKEALPKAAPA